MSTNKERETDELSPLDQQHRDELPQIRVASEDNVNLALEALDRYLAQNPPVDLEKSLLAWKGRSYIERQRYDDALRELREADALPSPHELSTFNANFDLALALENSGDLQSAYMVLTRALHQVEAPPLFLNLLPPLARIAASLNVVMPPRAQNALQLTKQFYGIDLLPEEYGSIEIHQLLEMVRDAGAAFSHLRVILGRTESPEERVELVEGYLSEVEIPYYKQLAEELLELVREDVVEDDYGPTSAPED